jgi:predicted restriction endonuclease
MRWTREQLLLALNLYHQTPFGKQHQRHPPIIALAEKLERTPSAVAMKLNNFTSLDPAERERGVKGLSGASQADRDIWIEFDQRFEALADASEPLLHDPATPSGPTENEATAKRRRHQSFFRKAVLGSYGNRCALTGLTFPSLLRASHIIPWSKAEEHRLNPRNGIALAGTYDLAFDQFLISFDDNYQLVVGPSLKENPQDQENRRAFLDRDGAELSLPEKNLPDPSFLNWHRAQIR